CFQIIASVAGLLGDPPGRGVRGTASEENPSGAHLDEEEDVQELQPHGLDREEVACRQPLGVPAQEGRPGQSRPPRRRGDPAPPEEAADGRGGAPVPEFEQLASEPPAAPPEVLAGQSRDQLAPIGRQRRPPTAATPTEGGPLAPDELAVPAEERLG